MKHLNPYNIFENSQEEPKYSEFPTTENEIHKLCKYYKIKNYTINKDLSIDVEGKVILKEKKLEYLPLNFNFINGDFIINDNNLKSLKGSPNKINGTFRISNNNTEIDSFEYTKVIDEDLLCTNCGIRTLKNFPIVNRFIFIQRNPIFSLIHPFINKNNKNKLIQEFNHYRITDGEIVYKDRLEMFCGDCDLEMPLILNIKRFYKIV